MADEWNFTGGVLTNDDLRAMGFSIPPGFRYACPTCGNKRCPRTGNDDLVCTGSNEAGQVGRYQDRDTGDETDGQA